jgi:glycosyltransferase involved in cell wall biosynthesis
MPVYNGEKYLSEAIISLLNQSFGSFELIISDNASTDLTNKICNDYLQTDDRIKYFRHEENIGIVENFEFVLNQSSSDLFMFFACDDYLESDQYLAEMVKKIDSGCDYCFSNVKIRTELQNEYVISNPIMEKFHGCYSNFEFCNATVDICSYQLYGLYKSNILKNNFHYLQSCRHFKCFAEGLFVHVMAANFYAGFAGNINFIYRRHTQNVSSVQTSKSLVYDFYRFTISLSSYYWALSSFSVIQKLVILKKIIIVHGFYFIKLIVRFLFKTMVASALSKSTQ